MGDKRIDAGPQTIPFIEGIRTAIQMTRTQPVAHNVGAGRDTGGVHLRIEKKGEKRRCRAGIKRGLRNRYYIEYAQIGRLTSDGSRSFGKFPATRQQQYACG